MNELKNKNLFYVGGIVRDEILKIPNFDTDMCYEGNAIEYAEKNGLNIIKKNPDFGTVRILLEDKEIDIASTREEDYPKAGHLPQVKNIGCLLNLDLKRRDFTINAIAKNTITKEIFDPYNGQSDIKNRILRVLHSKSFIDDPTRIVRGLKFSVRFNFELEPETKKLQEQYLDNINYDMSYHRLKKELMETFNLNNGKAFDLFIEQKIYKLLGENQKAPKISGEYIEKTIKKYNIDKPWIIYLSFFNDLPFQFTKKEKQIIEYASKTDLINSNCSIESIVISELKKELEC